MGSVILGLGYSLPSQILDNKYFASIVETSDEWIQERTGIKERRQAAANKSTSDLCREAADRAVKKAGISGEEIGLIIVATVTPDMLFPATACLVQDQLGAVNAGAFDLEAGCTGFIYGLTVADKFLMTGACKYVLVIGAEILTRIVDYEDRNTCVLFGDGAGAAVLGWDDSDYGISHTIIGSDGSGADYLKLPAGAALHPASHQTIADKMHFIQMNGKEVFKFASKKMVTLCEELLEASGLSYTDIDYFVPHQANLRIIQTAMKRMNIPPEKTLINLDKLGNMSAASIPVAMAMADEEGRFKRGDIILSVGFGAGLTFGGALIKWGRK